MTEFSTQRANGIDRGGHDFVPNFDSAPSRRPRVLLFAYSCCPNRGSEPGIGWNRAVEIAKYCDTWVITEENDWKPRISEFLAEHGPIPNLHFAFIPRQPWEVSVEYTPGLSYVAYRRWMRRAYRRAQQLHSEIKFDLAHQVTIATFREPCPLYQLGIPFVWGPIGGSQHFPWRFLPGAGMKGMCLEVARNIFSTVQLYTSPRVRRAAKNAAVVFSWNSENRRKLCRALGIDSVLLCDVGASNLPIVAPQLRSDSSKLRILWAGVLSTRKALELLIEALAQLPGDVAYELHVIGEGPCRRKWQQLAERRGVSKNIYWLGHVPHREAIQQFQWADVLVFTSLRDTTGTVILESLAAGKPVICLDHQGAGEIVTKDCGITISVTHRREVQRRLSEAIIELQRDGRRRLELSQNAQKRSEMFRWSVQARRIAAEYNRILKSIGSDACCRLSNETDYCECNQMPEGAMSELATSNVASESR